jgi:hypothetical protein
MNPTIVESTQKIGTQRGSFLAIQEPTANKLRPAANTNAPIEYKLTPAIAPVRIIAMPMIVSRNPKNPHNLAS